MDLGTSLRRRRGKRPRGGKSGGAGRRWPRTLAAALLLGLTGLGLGYGLATRVLFPAPPPPGDLAPVPRLLGTHLDEARRMLADAGLSVGKIEDVRHPRIDSGTVVGQSPLPGQLWPPSSPVRLTLSLGPERRVVPDVLARRDEWARNLLEATGFSVRADSAESESIPRGQVVAIEPEAGTELALPGEVSLTVSLGPPLVVMPRILGMTEQQARDTLESLGLVVEDVRAVFRFGRDRGIVVEQSPPADSLLQPGRRVRLSVGRGGR